MAATKLVFCQKNIYFQSNCFLAETNSQRYVFHILGLKKLNTTVYKKNSLTHGVPNSFMVATTFVLLQKDICLQLNFFLTEINI